MEIIRFIWNIWADFCGAGVLLLIVVSLFTSEWGGK